MEAKMKNILSFVFVICISLPNTVNSEKLHANCLMMGLIEFLKGIIFKILKK